MKNDALQTLESHYQIQVLLENRHQYARLSACRYSHSRVSLRIPILLETWDGIKMETP